MRREEWCRVRGWPYDVSSLGRVRRLETGKILQPVLTKLGYPRVSLSMSGRVTVFYVHHLVLEAFLEARPAGQEANHLNGNKTDNRPENLEWVTGLENKAHAYAIGLTPHGILNGHAKLTESDVHRIRRLLAKHIMSQREIAGIYGVDQGSISHIATGATWPRLEE